jgi:transcriptional regulator with XRE-family HTH domain
MATSTLAGVPTDEIGIVLSILRCARGWSQEELGSSSGMGSTAVSSYECGHAVPAVKEVVRLVAAMGYPLAALDDTRAYLERLRAGSSIPVPVHLPLRRGGAEAETPGAAPPVETGAP